MRNGLQAILLGPVSLGSTWTQPIGSVIFRCGTWYVVFRHVEENSRCLLLPHDYFPLISQTLSEAQAWYDQFQCEAGCQKSHWSVEYTSWNCVVPFPTGIPQAVVEVWMKLQCQ